MIIITWLKIHIYRAKCTVILQYLRVLYFCELCKCLQHCKQKVAINDLWEWLLVGVVTMNTHIIDVEPERAVLTAVMEVSVAL